MKANNKTIASTLSVADYIATVSDVERRNDAELFIELLRQVTGSEPIMWGTAIIGFGVHHYRYNSGREGDIAAIGFSARKQALSVYGLRTEKNAPLLEQLNLAQESKGCIYLKNVDHIDKTRLHEALANAYQERNNNATK